MSSLIEVRCRDATVLASVQRWIDQGRLEPPLPLRIDLTIGNVPRPQVDDPRPVFKQPGITIRSGGQDDRVTVSWDPLPAVAELVPWSGTADVYLSPEAVDRLDECLRFFMITTLIFLLRRSGWHHVHGATAVDPRGRGWLLAGNSQAGKSTTAALFASRGWAVGTDDIAFLSASPSHRVEVHAFRTRLALRPGGEELLAKSGGLPLAGRSKVGFWPEELGGSWVARIEPSVLLLTTVGAGLTTVQRLRPRDILAQLVRWSAWVALEPALAQEHLDLLARLGTQAETYRVSLGRDLFDVPNLLERLIP